MGLPAGPRPPRAHVLLGVEPDVNDPSIIEAAVQRRMDQLDQYALSNDRETREQVQKLMNEVAKARVKLTQRAKAKAKQAPPVVAPAAVPEPTAAERIAPTTPTAPKGAVEPTPFSVAATPRRAWFSWPRLSAEAWSLLGIVWLMSLLVTAVGAYFIATSRTPAVELASQSPANQTPAEQVTAPDAKPGDADDTSDPEPVATVDPEPGSDPEPDTDREPKPNPKPDNPPDATPQPAVVALSPMDKVMQINDRRARLQAYLELRDSMPSYSPEQIALIIEAARRFNDAPRMKIRISPAKLSMPGFMIQAPVSSGDLNHPNLKATDLSAFTGLEVDYFNIQNWRALQDFTVLSTMRIRSLNVEGCIGLKDLSVLNRCEGLQELHLGGNYLTSLKGLEIGSLKTLRITDSPVSDLSPLARMELDSLRLIHCYGLESLDALESMPPLTELYITDEPDSRLQDDYLRLRSIRPPSVTSYRAPEKPVVTIWPRSDLPVTPEPVVQTHIADHNKLDRFKDPSDRHAAFIKLRESYEPFSQEQSVLIQRELALLNNTNNVLFEMRADRDEPSIMIGVVGHVRGSNNNAITNLSPLRGINAHTLSIQQLAGLRSFDFLKGSTIHTLDLTGCNQFKDVSVFKEVKGLSVLRIGQTPVSDLRSLRLDSLQELVIDGCRSLRDLDGLQGMSIEVLSAVGCTSLREVSALASVKGLTSVNLAKTAIQSASPLARQGGLTTLSLSGCENLSTLAGLSRLKGLKTLYLHDTPLLDHVDTERLQKLLPDTTINFKDEGVALGPDPEANADADAPPDDDVPTVKTIQELMRIKDGQTRFKAYLKLRDSLELYSEQQKELIRWVFAASHNEQGMGLNLRRGEHGYDLSVTNLNLGGEDVRQKVTDLSAFSGMTFNKLDLSSCQNLKDLRPLEGATIRNLDLGWTGVTDLASINEIKGLQTLDLGSTAIVHVKQLDIDELDRLDLGRCRELRSLDGLEGMTIRSLNLEDGPKLTDLSALSRIKGLEYLELQSMNITSLRPLAGLKLKQLDVDSCNQLRSITELKKMDTLEVLYIRHTAVSERDIKSLQKLIPDARIWFE